MQAGQMGREAPCPIAIYFRGNVLVRGIKRDADKPWRKAVFPRVIEEECSWFT
jgi:hypothetical protein